MTEIFVISDTELELIKITLKALGKFCKFDSLKIFDTQNFYEVVTVSRAEKYMTRTKIGKFSWRVKECYYQKAGEEEVSLKKENAKAV
jgi:hypothetical protein